ncbi:hypothetical protein LOZ66_002071 [Ophidiomyces ophidiicola]|nr:hypothetical protein LOZ65_001550 [Ophidiomyces ophidiicola]KAI1940477.1 hypothetical protein LOZ66_002071 [Ophidiomyces ophidiicola]
MAPSRRKKPFLLRLKHWFFQLRFLESPLRLRNSVARLRHNHSHPIFALLQLFNPFPTWKFPVPEPVPPIHMLGNAKLEKHRRTGLVHLRTIPVWRARDTPLRSLYRMYDAMISGEYASLGPETEYFWYQRCWTLHDIPDPKDPDPVRYAILASLLEELVVAFNWRLSLGLRRDRKHIIRVRDCDPYPPYDPVVAPEWTSTVKPIIPADILGFSQDYVSEGKLVLEKSGLADIFAKRSIVTNVGWLYTI